MEPEKGQRGEALTPYFNRLGSFSLSGFLRHLWSSLLTDVLFSCLDFACKLHYPFASWPFSDIIIMSNKTEIRRLREAKGLAALLCFLILSGTLAMACHSEGSHGLQ
jgi:hypothetical protein